MCHFSSLSPVSGPIHGGTTVTIIGSDLGISVTDIRQILIGRFPCILQENKYIPGKFQDIISTCGVLIINSPIIPVTS